MRFLVADEGVGNVAEGALNGLLIPYEGLLVLRFGQLQISAESSSGENRLADLRAVGPDSELRGHQAGEGAAAAEGPATGTGQGNLRKKLSLGHANFGVG